MGHIEKRRSPRLDTNNFISYYLLDENDKIYSEGFGKTKNISDVGLLMVTGKEIESAYILIVATDEKNNIIEMKGKVCHAKKDEAGVILTGIEFTGDKQENAQFATHLKNAYQMTQDSSSLSVGF
jgi:hypothetical protein